MVAQHEAHQALTEAESNALVQTFLTSNTVVDLVDLATVMFVTIKVAWLYR